MSAASVALAILGAPVAAASGYLLALALLSRRPAPSEPGPSQLRFDIVVPAYNEALGIASTVRSLLQLDYPRELFRVLVVADNCSDETAECARDAGAAVLVRADLERRGKGHALAHAFSFSAAEKWADAVVVVDADTLASPNLLRAFAARLAAGAMAVQADYGVRNPHASWRTRLMTIALASVHGLRSLARHRLGLSCGLRGNGMCFTMELLREVPYDAFSVVEDLEYGIRLGEAGHRVHYAGEAHVYGEMPVHEGGSSTQRRRWEGGRSLMVRQHGRRLLLRALRRRDKVCLDLALDLYVPPLATLVSATALGIAVSLLLSFYEGALAQVTYLWAACAVGLVVYGIRGWQLSDSGLRGLASFVHIPRYLVWKILLLVRRSRQPNTEWVRTARPGEEGP